MENQKKYEQAFYNICQLVLNRKYRRAIYIADHIINQGFSNHELLTLKSYAISKSQGARQALESIQYQQGPLIALAKAQYSQSLQEWSQAQGSFSTLISEGNPAPMDSLSQSNKILMTEVSNKVETINSNNVMFVSQHKQSQCITKINEITILYNNLKERKQNHLLQDDKEFKAQCSELAKKYEKVLREYRPNKRIVVGVQQYIKFLRNVAEQQQQ